MACLLACHLPSMSSARILLSLFCEQLSSHPAPSGASLLDTGSAWRFSVRVSSRARCSAACSCSCALRDDSIACWVFASSRPQSSRPCRASDLSICSFVLPCATWSRAYFVAQCEPVCALSEAVCFASLRWLRSPCGAVWLYAPRFPPADGKSCRRCAYGAFRMWHPLSPGSPSRSSVRPAGCM